MLAIAAMGESSSSGAAAAAAAAGAVLKHREPTPDHPPYSWMIGEAIAALGEGGGSAEAAISDFIRARHPGVPAAHDRFLRHYLAKHVAEGLFVCSATGQYSCRTHDEDEPVLELEGAPAAANTGSPATEPKRGRGRPRKDGSAPTPAVGNKAKSESRSVTPKGRGRPRKDGSPAGSAGSPATEGKRGPGRPRKDGSSPSPAGGKKGGSGSPSEMPKRGRGRPRVLPQIAAADFSGGARVTDMKDGGDAPSTTDNNHGEPRELALVVVYNRSTAPSVMEDDGGEAPPAKLPLLAKEPAAFTTPEHSNQPFELAFIAADEGSATALATDKEDGAQAPLESSAPALAADKEHGAQAPLEGYALTLATGKEDGAHVPLEGSAPALATDKEDGAQASFEGSAPALATGKEDGAQAPFEGSAPALATGKDDGAQAPLEGSAPVLPTHKEDGAQAPFEGSVPAIAADKEDCTQAPLEGSAPPLVANKEDGTQTPFEWSAPVLVADKDEFTEPLFTKHKRRRRTVRSAPVKAAPAPAWTSVPENKAGGMALSAPPKVRGWQCKPASAAAGELRPRRPVLIKPRKMLLLNADVVPDHSRFCVLALRAPVPAAAKA